MVMRYGTPGFTRPDRCTLTNQRCGGIVSITYGCPEGEKAGRIARRRDLVIRKTRGACGNRVRLVRPCCHVIAVTQVQQKLKNLVVLTKIFLLDIAEGLIKGVV